jgi:hypothetical protein
MNSKSIIGIIVVLVIIVAAATLLSGLGSKTGAPVGVPNTTQQQTTILQSSSGKYTSTPVVVTDPGHVPVGTQAMVISYSSLQVQQSGPSGSDWVNANSMASGSVNLTAVQNGTSKVIGYANITPNATIAATKFIITSAYIVVNGTKYVVQVPNDQVIINITSATKINQSTKAGVIIDVAPTVSAVYNQNSTAYVMASTSAKAAIAKNISAQASAGVGAQVSLNANAKASLAAAAPNITITSANISVNGNVTTIYVTVKDNSNAAVTLNNVFMSGNQAVQASSSASSNASAVAGITGALGAGRSRGSIGLNTSALLKLGLNIEANGEIDFVVAPGGSMTAVTTGNEDFQGSGATIMAGQTSTFSYSSMLTYNSGTLIAKPKSGSQYQITVTGNSGAQASVTVTAS